MADDTEKAEVTEDQAVAELWATYLELRQQGKYVMAHDCNYLTLFDKGMC